MYKQILYYLQMLQKGQVVHVVYMDMWNFGISINCIIVVKQTTCMLQWDTKYGCKLHQVINTNDHGNQL